jgi:hypothetical protein
LEPGKKEKKNFHTGPNKPYFFSSPLLENLGPDLNPASIGDVTSPSSFRAHFPKTINHLTFQGHKKLAVSVLLAK